MSPRSRRLVAAAFRLAHLVDSVALAAAVVVGVLAVALWAAASGAEAVPAVIVLRQGR